MKDVKKLQKLLQILGDANRLKILHLIGDKELAVSEIVAEVNLSQPLVSHHLKAMKDNSLLSVTRKGPFIYYRVTDPQLLDVLGILSDMAQNIEEQLSDEPMFRCPPWWRKMNKK